MCEKGEKGNKKYKLPGVKIVLRHRAWGIESVM